jgi:hypothetical protein
MRTRTLPMVCLDTTRIFVAQLNLDAASSYHGTSKTINPSHAPALSLLCTAGNLPLSAASQCSVNLL